jgi:antitoxin VapB
MVEFSLLSTYDLSMALSIKSPEVERLVEALAEMTGESKTEAVRRAVSERSARLSLQTGRRERGSDFLRYLAEEVWPKAPPGQLGRRLSREEEDEILGYGPEGV